MIISKTAEIADNRKKSATIAERVQRKRAEGKDIRPFGDILQEELQKELSSDKFDDNWIEKAIEDTDQSSPR